MLILKYKLLAFQTDNHTNTSSLNFCQNISGTILPTLKYASQLAADVKSTHTRLMALFPGLPRWTATRKVKPIWILLKQETVSGSGISWAICKSAPRSRQITTPAPHHSVFYRPDALPAAQPTASKYWRQHVKSTVFVNLSKHEQNNINYYYPR